MTSDVIGAHFFLRAWRGQERLWKVFWIGLVDAFIIVTILEIIFNHLLSSIFPKTSEGWTFAILPFTPILLWIWLVCKNSRNADSKMWGILLKFLAALFVVLCGAIYFWSFQ